MLRCTVCSPAFRLDNHSSSHAVLRLSDLKVQSFGFVPGLRFGHLLAMPRWRGESPQPIALHALQPGQIQCLGLDFGKAMSKSFHAFFFKKCLTGNLRQGEGHIFRFPGDETSDDCQTCYGLVTRSSGTSPASCSDCPPGKWNDGTQEQKNPVGSFFKRMVVCGCHFYGL